MGQDRSRRGIPRDGADREAPRRILSLAQQTTTIRGAESGATVRETWCGGSWMLPAHGLKPGLYCSRGIATTLLRRLAALKRLFADQLTELLTQYGPDPRIWFDGANGEAPTDVAGVRLARMFGVCEAASAER